MKFPKRINIMGVNYPISFTKRTNAMAEFSTIPPYIIISSNPKYKSEIKSTLFHEIIEIIFARMGICYKNEKKWGKDGRYFILSHCPNYAILDITNDNKDNYDLFLSVFIDTMTRNNLWSFFGGKT